MNQEETNYLNLLQSILTTGEKRSDRTGIGTISKFGTQLRFSLEDGKIPMLTTKKMFARGVIEELLFFIRGETDTKKLEAKGVNIWKGNTSREFLDKRGLHHLPEGNMGKGYGYQWKRFGETDVANNFTFDSDDHTVAGTDQLTNVINLLKTDPISRRILVSAWNPNELHEIALPPCHILYQFYVGGKDLNELSCQFIMRTIDTFLGFPFNVLSYALLTHIIAQTVGMKAKELIFVGGDTHIYNNHVEQVKEQILREPYEFPTLKINKKLLTLEDIEKLEFADFQIENYKSHPAIKAEMAV